MSHVCQRLKFRCWITGPVLLAVITSGVRLTAQETEPPSAMFLRFIKAQAAALRAEDQTPASRDEWQQRRAMLRENLIKAWGGFPDEPCDLAPRKLGELQRDGYRIEKIIFQTRPGVWMTANAYVPDKAKDEKSPAILHVHGHWAGAKQDPVVQSRCIGCVKHGFFVLVVDAFGAGERGIGKNLGEYHGEMTAATLFPIGRPLSGLQVYENMRAVDYLQTRPEVDGSRIGITGASGGGNQTLYAGAFDERFKCVVPTCSVGNYQAYLGPACCMCEVVPNALRFTEEGDVLGLAADRGLMITSATQDGIQFSVGEAKKSFVRVTDIAKLLGTPDGVKHTIIESPHAYNQPMREALYGWMTRHLKGQGDGSPLPDPDIKTEEPESLRCFPGDSRPNDYITIPRFAALEACRLLESRKAPADRISWNDERPRRLAALERVFGDRPKPTSLNRRSEPLADSKSQRLIFDAEPGITLDVRHDLTKTPQRIAVLLDFDSGAQQSFSSDLANEWRKHGWTIAAPELRATSRFALPNDKIGNAPDHNTAEWSLWIGRPLLGQWVLDVGRTLDALAEHNGSALPDHVAVIGVGSAGLVSLCAAALDERITHAVTINSLASYVSARPYRNQRLGVMVPGILRDVGDVDHIAALIAPRQIAIVGGVTGDGETIHGDDLARQFRFSRSVFSVQNASPKLRVVPNGNFWDGD